MLSTIWPVYQRPICSINDLISRGLLTILLATTMLELVCAQAPYNMRGLYGGCMTLAFFSSSNISDFYPLNITLTIIIAT